MPYIDPSLREIFLEFSSTYGHYSFRPRTPILEIRSYEPHSPLNFEKDRENDLYRSLFET